MNGYVVPNRWYNNLWKYKTYEYYDWYLLILFLDDDFRYFYTHHRRRITTYKSLRVGNIIYTYILYMCSIYRPTRTKTAGVIFATSNSLRINTFTAVRKYLWSNYDAVVLRVNRSYRPCEKLAKKTTVDDSGSVKRSSNTCAQLARSKTRWNFPPSCSFRAGERYYIDYYIPIFFFFIFFSAVYNVICRDVGRVTETGLEQYLFFNDLSGRRIFFSPIKVNGQYYFRQ